MSANGRCAANDTVIHPPRRRYTETTWGGEAEESVMNDAEAMKTYVAEINGEAIIAFRAMDDEDAHDMVNDEDSELRESLDESSGVVRADGSPLWDGKSKIIARRATEVEEESWREARDAEIGSADESEPIETEIEDDFDDFNVYLVDVKAADDEEGAA
jgi:hypothetical protein